MSIMAVITTAATTMTIEVVGLIGTRTSPGLRRMSTVVEIGDRRYQYSSQWNDVPCRAHNITGDSAPTTAPILVRIVTTIAILTVTTMIWAAIVMLITVEYLSQTLVSSKLANAPK